jgi:putative Mg2+ transporter-C (MgtC) family protein
MDVYLDMTLRLLAALVAGGMIGLERSYHGRPAGFRTHALVCLSTALLMLVTVYEDWWFRQIDTTRAVIDPTRMAQGIMTGIGFIGAGAIIKEGLTVRGLTTAASIWITAAIGVMIGVGFHFPAALATVLTLGTLSVFRHIESRMPSEFYAHFSVRFTREAAMDEAALRELVASHGFTIFNINYRMNARENFLEYRMVVRSRRAQSAQTLAGALKGLASVQEFRLSPTGD